MKKVRFMAVVLAFLLLLTVISPSQLLVNAIGSGREDLVANLASAEAIANLGLPASGMYRRSGEYTMKLAGADLERNITIPVIRHDLTGGKYLEMWVYSVNKTPYSLKLAMVSDVPETVCMDYYYAPIQIDWEGWNKISLPYQGENSVFKKINSPAGVHQIDFIKLIPDRSEPLANSGIELYFDSITCVGEKSGSSEQTGGNQFVLGDFSKEGNIVSAGFPVSDKRTLSGDVSLKWAGADLKRSPIFSSFPKDWTPYKTIVADIYSEKATNAQMNMIIISQNTETEGDDYYRAVMEVDWVGWKTVTLKIGDDSSDFSKSRSPLGWDNVTEFTFWPAFGGVAPDPSTELYVDKIYLTDQNVSGSGGTAAGEDYLIQAIPKEHYVDVVSKVKANLGDAGHPRLLFNRQELENMKVLVKTDPFMEKSLVRLKAAADTAVKTPIAVYEKPDGLRLPRTGPDMMPSLALAYQLTGELKYKERLWQEVEAICNFPNWNPTHFLDVGDFARGMAYAYDWMYDEWTEEQRQIMRNAMVKHGFAVSMKHLREKTGFAGQINNWNQVINSGLGMAALSFAEQPGYEDLINEVVNLTAESLPIAVASFAPDGVCQEGPAYWSYAQRNFFQYQNAMMSAMNFDFGLAQLPGLEKTGHFIINITGASGQAFNFGDGSANRVVDGVFFWLGRLYNKPELGGYELAMCPNGGIWSDMAMYRPDSRQQDFSESMPLDSIFRGQQEMSAFRSSWDDANALSVAVKGGYNQASHCDLDLGTLVIDAHGQRWVKELGSDDYGAPGMFDFGEDAGRWMYYRKNPEGSNTLLINPSGGKRPLQNVMASAAITHYESSEAAAYAIIDLSEAYQDFADEVKRGVGLINNRSSVIVQDEIRTNGPSEIYSTFHTDAEVEISADKKSAILTQNKKRMKVDILAPQNAELIVGAAEPLTSSPKPPVPNQNNGNTKKIQVHVDNALNPTVSVLFTPLIGEQPIPALPKLIPLAEWEIYKNERPGLTEIFVDNVPITGFTPYNPFYRIDTGITGIVSAQGQDDVIVEIQQAEEVNESAYITATTPDGMQSVYVVSFAERQAEVFTKGLEGYPVQKVIASAEPQMSNLALNTIDGSLESRWSAPGEAWIQWDLGEVREIQQVLLSFMNGSDRMSIFRIEVSEDGVNYQEVYDGSSSGQSNHLEAFQFPMVKARFIRYMGSGNTVNEWNSITEFRAFGNTAEFTDMDGHWAKEEVELFRSLGFVEGVTEELFMPEEPVTRAEFSAMLVRALGMEEKDYQGQFADVNGKEWFSGILSAVEQRGILPAEMFPEKNVMPDAPISREEMAVMLVRAYEAVTGREGEDFNLENFRDRELISEYARSYVGKGMTLRLLKGTENGIFSPRDNASRAQAVVMLKRLLTQTGA